MGVTSMQAKRYLQPSARSSRTHMRRNVLSTFEKREDADASWLNDVSPASSSTQAHMVSYEDVPTMPLSVLFPSPTLQMAERQEEILDDDRTVRLNKHKKEQMINIMFSLSTDAKPVHSVQIQFADGTSYTIKAAL